MFGLALALLLGDSLRLHVVRYFILPFSDISEPHIIHFVGSPAEPPFPRTLPERYRVARLIGRKIFDAYASSLVSDFAVPDSLLRGSRVLISHGRPYISLYAVVSVPCGVCASISTSAGCNQRPHETEQGSKSIDIYASIKPPENLQKTSTKPSASHEHSVS